MIKLLRRLVKRLDKWLTGQAQKEFSAEVDKYFEQKKQDRQYYDKYQDHTK